MKYLLILGCFLFSSVAQAQPTRQLEVTTNKTTTVIFDYPILNVDRGSADVLVQLVDGTTNAIQLKAGRQNFEETNVSVLTQDGQVHELTITFLRSPLQRIYRIHSPDENVLPIALQKAVDIRMIEKLFKKIASRARRGKVVADRKHKMKIELKDIFIHDDILLLHLQVANKSKVAYNISSLRFFIKDKQGARRIAVQEQAVKPLYQSRASSYIKGEEKAQLIFAFEKFTIPHAKKFCIEFREQDGGRNFLLTVRHGKLIRPREL